MLKQHYARLGCFGIAILVIALDQFSKSLVSANLHYAEVIDITSFFDITLRHNYGVAFSILDNSSGSQRWYLAALSLLVSSAISVWIFRTAKSLSIETIGLSLVLGGALGNLWNRIQLGYVVDFIEVHYQQYYFPAFNVADSAVCIGAALLIFDSVFGVSAKRKKSA